MKKLNVSVTLAAAVLLVVACGKGNNPNPAPGPGYGYPGYGGYGSCGGVQGVPLSTSPFVGTLTSQMGGGYNAMPDSISLMLASPNASMQWGTPSTTIIGSATISLPDLFQTGYPGGNNATTCVTSAAPSNSVPLPPGQFNSYQGQVTNLALQGMIQAPNPYGGPQMIPTPLQVIVGSPCPVQIPPPTNGAANPYSNRMQGCVTVILGNGQQIVYQSQ